MWKPRQLRKINSFVLLESESFLPYQLPKSLFAYYFPHLWSPCRGLPARTSCRDCRYVPPPTMGIMKWHSLVTFNRAAASCFLCFRRKLSKQLIILSNFDSLSCGTFSAFPVWKYLLTNEDHTTKMKACRTCWLLHESNQSLARSSLCYKATDTMDEQNSTSF